MQTRKSADQASCRKIRAIIPDIEYAEELSLPLPSIGYKTSYSNLKIPIVAADYEDETDLRPYGIFKLGLPCFGEFTGAAEQSFRPESEIQYFYDVGRPKTPAAEWVEARDQRHAEEQRFEELAYSQLDREWTTWYASSTAGEWGRAACWASVWGCFFHARFIFLDS